MPLVALTGGIASGKSTIAARLAELGAVVIDADAVVRELQQPGMPVLRAIAEEFGDRLVLPDGSLDRAALGARVFADERARLRLNAIVHPAVAAESARRFGLALDEDPRAVVVYDVPLLVEARPDDPWDLVVVAHAPAETRVRRLVELRGMDEADARARVAAQASDARRLAIADVVIETDGDLPSTLAQADALWQRLSSADVGGRSWACTMQATRAVRPFEVISDYTPSGDQPKAIRELTEALGRGETDVVLLGATGTGKSATTAWLIEQVQRPTLVLAHNKTLAAQLANEFRELLPNNAVEYFVSYYDYYQPEAYIPQTDTFIEKDSSLNAEVERLRHSATNALLSRRDVVVVSTVSCIYGLGTPEEYLEAMIALQVGMRIDRQALLRRFVAMQYQRNDVAFTRGTFRVRGDTIEIIPMYEEHAIRIELFGDEVEAITTLHPLTGEVLQTHESVSIFPGSHYVAGNERMQKAMDRIRDELDERLKVLEREGKLLEAQRLRMRTTFDLEMMEQIGFCSGIENYSRHIDGRGPGEPPHCLLDYFADDFLVVIDESHVTVPQIGAMYEGDASRKRSLVEHGFRLPSALDNRPLKFDEFLERTPQKVYLSATPGKYEMGLADSVVEQIIRPTGLVDPKLVVKPTKGQIDDLLEEIRVRAERDERVLVTTLTKKMAEELTEYFTEAGVRVRYLHSDVDTLRRVELLTQLRQGLFDVLVGINLLREGLDLPEVSLVAILDADKEGFLRSSTSLIQTIGRAARNVSGEVHMYADRITDSMRLAIDETDRRRAVQVAYNLEHGIDPTPLRRRIADITEVLSREQADTDELLQGARRGAPTPRLARDRSAMDGPTQLESIIADLTAQMTEAAGELKFELAARIRDELHDLKRDLRQMRAAS